MLPYVELLGALSVVSRHVFFSFLERWNWKITVLFWIISGASTSDAVRNEINRYLCNIATPTIYHGSVSSYVRHTFRLRIWHVYYENSPTIFLRYTPFIPVKNGRDFRPQRPRKMINFEPKILLHAARQLRFLNWMLRRMEGELTIGLVKFVLA